MGQFLKVSVLILNELTSPFLLIVKSSVYPRLSTLEV